mgnify:CR=1 FL=1
MKLSVCTIARNEQEDLPGFIEHLLDWVYEIVIIDDDSEDNTKSIALSYGNKIKFIENPMGNNKHFAKQRNLSIKHASGDWLIHMDIDERVTPKLKQSILNSLKLEKYNAFKYRRLNHFLHYPMLHGGWHKWNRPQLARRNKHYFRNKVHEVCIIEGAENKIGQLKGFMWHFIDASYEERLRKNITYSKLTAEQILKKVEKVKWYHIIFHPFYRMLKSYIYYKGFLDGTKGLVFSLYTGLSTLNWWIFAWEYQNKITRKELENKFLKNKI